MYRVIIIEDDPMVAAINRQYVERLKRFRVEGTFKCGSDALVYLAGREVDLIVLDYYTPLMNGTQFLDQLHGMGKAPGVIMVTSANDVEIVRGLLARGVMDYLVKPFEYERFRGALEKFCQTQDLLRGQGGGLSQGEIDRLTAGAGGAPALGEPLAKGLNTATLELVRTFLLDHPDEAFSSEQVAEGVGLSRITIRRYMNHMVQTGEIASAIDYQTGGRPSIKYRYQSKQEASSWDTILTKGEH